VITYINGDLCKADAPYILHGCNAQGVMGSGVAKAIRTHWPEAYDAYRAEYEKNGLDIGDVVFVHVTHWDNPKEKEHTCPVICNCITQKFYGRDGKQYVNYKAVRACLMEIADISRGKKIAMSKIGSSLGGGDWDVIEQIIKEKLVDNEVEIYVYDG